MLSSAESTAVVKTKDAQGNIQTKTVSINGNSAVDMDLKSIKVFDADTGAELAVSDYSYVDIRSGGS